MMFIKKILLNYSTFVLKLIIPLFSIPLIARLVDDKYFNEYMLFLGVSTFSAIFFEFAYNQIAIPKLSKSSNGDDLVTYYESGRLVLWCSAIFVSLFLILFDFDVYALSLISGALLGLLPVYYFQAKDDFKYLMLVELSSNLIFVLIVLFFVFFDFYHFIEAFLVYRLSLFLIMYYKFSKVVNWASINFKDGLCCLKECFMMMVARLSASANTSINVPLVGVMLGVSAVGMYAVPEKLTFMLISLIYPFTQVLTVHVSKNGLSKNITLFGMILVVFSFIVAYVVSIFSDELISIILGVDNIPASDVLSLLVFIVPLRMASNFVVSALYYPKERHSEYAKIMIFFGCFGLLLNASLIHHFGVVGIVWGLLVTEMLLFFYMLFNAKESRAI